MHIRKTQPALDRIDYFIAVGVFAAAMALYARTLATTLLLGDSAEFQTLAYTLGLAHPTGYPIYLLLAKVFTLLPARDIAYRVNLFSAFSAALALALLYLLGRALGTRRSAALAGLAALAVCRLFWWHAVIAEVYAPAAAALALILLLVVLWGRGGSLRLLFWAGLVGGLSAGIHYTVLLAAPAAAVYLLLRSLRPAMVVGERQPLWRTMAKSWLAAGGGALLGLLLYGGALFGLDALHAPSSYLPSIVEPNLSVLDITAEEYASPLGRVLYLATGKQFQGQLAARGKDRLAENLKAYRETALDQFGRLAIGLALLGFAGMAVTRAPGYGLRWREALLLLLAVAAQVAYAIHYDIGDIFVFYIPGYVLLAAAASMGGGLLLDGAAWLVERIHALRGRFSSDLCWVLGLALAAAITQPVWLTVKTGWQEQRITFLDGTDFQEYPFPVEHPEWPAEWARDVASHIEDNAVVFTDWSVLYTLYYVTHVEEGRTGITFIESYPAMLPKPFSDTAMQYIADRYPTRPIYITLRDSRVGQQYTLAPVTLRLYQLKKR